ncbi:MAG TPA: hypothetical protein VHD84_02425 [Candidatus Saccharimonadales bacterium]|nr:hypothetical protein [Candidatus Saccharimonadales bacterium]
MGTKKKLYVGCALTHATEEFRASIEKLKGTLRAEGYVILDFFWVKEADPTPKDVFEWDIRNCVKNCDGFVAICDHPSLGLGYELAEAANLGKPILGVAHKDTKVTRLILGAADVLPNFQFERYGNLDKDIVPLVNKWLAKTLG